MKVNFRFRQWAIAVVDDGDGGFKFFPDGFGDGSCNYFFEFGDGFVFECVRHEVGHR